MNKLLQAFALGLSIVIASPIVVYAADSSAPVVTNFGPATQTIDLSKGLRAVTISGNVSDESGVEWMSFQCDNPLDNYKRSFAISIMFTASYPKGWVGLTMGYAGATTHPVHTISGDKKSFSFSITAGIPLETPAVSCNWMLASVDALGNRGSRDFLGATLQIIDNTGATWKAPEVNSQPTPTPTASIPPALPAISEITWGVEGSKLIISVKNAKNKNLRIDTPLGSEKRFITSDVETVELTAYRGSANRIYIDGVPSGVAFVLATEGVKKVTGKPVFSSKWIGNSLKVSGSNIQYGSDIRIQLGSKTLESLVANDSEISNSFEGLTADVVKIFQGEVLSFNQQSGKYTSCAKLNAVYTGGVSNKAKSVNKGGKASLSPTFYPKLYNLNKSLDRDKDGIACEK